MTATHPPAVTNWTVSPKASEFAATVSPAFGEVRLALVSVRAPYDVKSLVVLRPDGSVAFDPYNQFACAPSALIKGAALDILRGSGLFKGVLPAVTTADVPHSLELTVEEFALDCRKAGERAATARVTLALLEGRKVLMARHGEASCEVGTGGYSAAFGAALTAAITQATVQLTK